MPWCPKCKNEYVEGVTACADCNCGLVESLELAEQEAVTFGTAEEMGPLLDFLKVSGIKSAQLKPAEEDGIVELCTGGSEKKKAEHAILVYQKEILPLEKSKAGRDGAQYTESPEHLKEMQAAGKEQEQAKQIQALQQSQTVWQADNTGDEETAESDFPEFGEEELTPDQKPAALFRGSHVYQKSSEKAEEFKSSAYVLLIVGIAGLAALILILADLLPIRLGGLNKYLIGGVMGAMFVLFIVMGVLSLRSSKTLLGKAAREDELTKEIMNWCGKNLTDAVVDTCLSGQQGMQEEEKYFKRAVFMRERISNQFLNLDENYLEQLVDDYYQEIFG